MRFFVALLLLVALSSTFYAQVKPAQDDLESLLEPVQVDYSKDGPPLFQEHEYQAKTGWRLIALTDPDSDGHLINVFYDRARITIPAPHVKRAWLKQYNYKGDEVESHDVTLFEFNCHDPAFRVISSASYTSETATPTTNDVPSKWKFVTPDSVAEQIFGTLCNRVTDMEELDMRTAARMYAAGRHQEILAMVHNFEMDKYPEFKSIYLRNALDYYQTAIGYAPGNSTILRAIARVQAAGPAPPEEEK